MVLGTFAIMLIRNVIWLILAGYSMAQFPQVAFPPQPQLSQPGMGGLTSQQFPVPSPSPFCPVAYGDFPNPASESCASYFRCVQGRPMALRCPRGQAFDYLLRRCGRREEVNCERQLQLFAGPPSVSPFDQLLGAQAGLGQARGPFGQQGPGNLAQLFGQGNIGAGHPGVLGQQGAFGQGVLGQQGALGQGPLGQQGAFGQGILGQILPQGTLGQQPQAGALPLRQAQGDGLISQLLGQSTGPVTLASDGQLTASNGQAVGNVLKTESGAVVILKRPEGGAAAAATATTQSGQPGLPTGGPAAGLGGLGALGGLGGLGAGRGNTLSSILPMLKQLFPQGTGATAAKAAADKPGRAAGKDTPSAAPDPADGSPSSTTRNATRAQPQPAGATPQATAKDTATAANFWAAVPQHEDAASQQMDRAQASGQDNLVSDRAQASGQGNLVNARAQASGQDNLVSDRAQASGQGNLVNARAQASGQGNLVNDRAQASGQDNLVNADTSSPAQLKADAASKGKVGDKKSKKK